MAVFFIHTSKICHFVRDILSDTLINIKLMIIKWMSVF